MPEPLVSICMPTRNHFDSLHQALSSIKDTAHGFCSIEILLRIDDDDDERIALIPELEQKYNAKCVVGPRGKGYVEMGRFVTDLVKVATGKWCWLFDDDAWIAGPWQEGFEKMPMDTGVNTQWYCLGGSRYANGSDGGPPGIAVPRDLVKDIECRSPVDDHWLCLVKDKGWKLKLLEGVSYYHNGRNR